MTVIPEWNVCHDKDARGTQLSKLERFVLENEHDGMYAAERFRKQLAEAIEEAITNHCGNSGMSWDGYNLFGDEKSIAKAREMLHDSQTVPELKQRIRELQK